MQDTESCLQSFSVAVNAKLLTQRLLRIPALKFQCQ